MIAVLVRAESCAGSHEVLNPGRCGVGEALVPQENFFLCGGEVGVGLSEESSESGWCNGFVGERRRPEGGGAVAVACG